MHTTVMVEWYIFRCKNMKGVIFRTVKNYFYQLVSVRRSFFRFIRKSSIYDTFVLSIWIFFT